MKFDRIHLLTSNLHTSKNVSVFHYSGGDEVEVSYNKVSIPLTVTTEYNINNQQDVWYYCYSCNAHHFSATTSACTITNLGTLGLRVCVCIFMRACVSLCVFLSGRG